MLTDKERDYTIGEDRPGVSSNRAREITSEQWLKFLNCLEDVRRKFLQRLYDPAPIWKRYREGEVEAHFHFKRPHSLCLRGRRELFGPLEYFLHLTEFPMSVRVGVVAENLESVPSVVRLVSLEKCDMLIGNALEKPVPVSFEALYATFNRKLDTVAHDARLRLLFGKSASRIVQCVAKAACVLAEDNPYPSDIQIERLLSDVEAQFLGNKISIRVNDTLSEPLQMFVCPFQQEFDFLELIQHAAFLASAAEPCA